MSESKKNSAIIEVRNYLETSAVEQQIKKALPPSLHATEDRKNQMVHHLVRSAVTLCNDNPRLYQCTQRSLVAGIMRAAELGLELNGVLGQAYLIPYKIKGVEEATFQVGYRGLIDLAFRSGKISAFPMRVVYMNEPFEIHYGTRNVLSHSPLPPESRGEVLGFYSCAIFVSGGCDFEFAFKTEVDEHAQRYSRSFASASSPWQTNYIPMACKTTARKLCKRVPLSPEAQMAALIDEYGERGFLPEQQQSLTETQESRTEALRQLLPDDSAYEPIETAG